MIHSLFVPAFRIKMDVVPGRYTKVWFEATEPGEYDLFCAEYCGTSHSDMMAQVVVHAPGEFETWLEEASNFLETMTPVEAGRKLFQVRGCTAVPLGGRLGQDRADLPRRLRPHRDRWPTASTVTVDENYIRESILEPQAKVVAGFEPVMPTYQGRLKDEEIMAIIEYIKTLDGASQRGVAADG